MLSYRLLAVIFVFDQLLLPVFHVGGMPMKVSYLIVGAWLLDVARRAPANEIEIESRQDFVRLAIAVALIIGASVIGDLWLSTQGPISSYSESIRSNGIYLLMLLSFGLGQSARAFDVGMLVPLLLVSIAANFAMTFFGHALPALVDLYYDPATADHVLDFSRPRGIFGNPNVSMLQVDIIFLFVVIGTRRGLVPIMPRSRRLVVAVLPLLTAILLGARGEMIVSTVLALTFLSAGSSRGGRRVNGRAIAAVIGVAAGAVIVRVAVGLVDNLAVVHDAFSRILKTPGELLDPTNRISSVFRPLLVWEIVVARFSRSPIVGSGYETLATWPFNYSPTYLHNDWFHVLVTSGLVGFAALIYILRRFCVPILGLLGLIPFVLPGLTNTFILAIPSLMFYFFMLGWFLERGRRDRGGFFANRSAEFVPALQNESV